MNPEVKALWVKALRSRKYKQGQHYLVQGAEGNRQHCCMGVLCEIAPEGLTELIGTHLTEIMGYRTTRPDGRAKAISFPPVAVAAWADLDRDAQGVLANMNDSGKAGFRKIATWIEGNL